MPFVQFFAFNASIAAELKTRVTEEALFDPFKKDGKEWFPSSYQDKFFEWMRHGKGSAILKAVAGSGKTTSIIASLGFINNLKAKDVSCGTFHSVGFRAVVKRLGVKDLKPNGNKIRNIVTSMYNREFVDVYGDFIVKLVGLAKGQGIGPLCPDTNDTWYGLIQHHDMYLDHEDASEDMAVRCAREVLAKSNMMADDRTNPVIDFDDMLYLPLLWRCTLWRNDYVFIDEAQDTNPVRRAIAKLALRVGGRLIAVGDPRQAIYGFTGASHDAMDLIREEFNCTELPLTVSYRCPKTIMERVKAIVPYFQVPEDAIQGEVSHLTLTEAMKTLGPQDAILCRQTAPLVALAFHLIANNRGCRVLGKEIGTGLVALIRKLNARGIDNLVEKLHAFLDREYAKHMAKGEEGKAEAVTDRVGCITTVIDNLRETERTVPALISRIEGLFSDTEGTLSLATVHKVKGKEYDHVAILSPELMPSPWARQEWQALQERNLQYVAWTRARKILIELVTDKLTPERKEGV